MNLLNIKVITKESMVPIKYLDDMKLIAEEGNKGYICSQYAEWSNIFEYGRIVGIQQERARRQGKTYEKPYLVDDLFMELFDAVHEAVKDSSTEELQDFFTDIKENAKENMKAWDKDAIQGIINGIRMIELKQREEAIS